MDVSEIFSDGMGGNMSRSADIFLGTITSMTSAGTLTTYQSGATFHMDPPLFRTLRTEWCWYYSRVGTNEPPGYLRIGC